MSSAHARPVLLALIRVGGAARMSCAHARLALLALLRVGGACGPPPPVAAALASSLRAPSRGDPPLRGRAVSWLPPGRSGQRRNVEVRVSAQERTTSLAPAISPTTTTQGAVKGAALRRAAACQSS